MEVGHKEASTDKFNRVMRDIRDDFQEAIRDVKNVEKQFSERL